MYSQADMSLLVGTKHSNGLFTFGLSTELYVVNSPPPAPVVFEFVCPGNSGDSTTQDDSTQSTEIFQDPVQLSTRRTNFSEGIYPPPSDQKDLPKFFAHTRMAGDEHFTFTFEE